MAYGRIITAYQIDGATPLDDRYDDGIVTDAIDLRYILTAFGGCGGGQLQLPGNVRSPFALPIGAIIKHQFDSEAAPDYAGIIAGRSRAVDGDRHTYQLQSPADWFAKLTARERVELAASPEDAADYLLTEYVAPVLPMITWDAGEFAASGWTMAAYLIEQERPLREMFDELAEMASANGQRVIWRIDADFVFHFEVLPDEVVSTFTVGLDATRGEETINIGDLLARVRVLGNLIDRLEGRFRSSRTFANISGPGLARPYVVSTPALNREADMEGLANGIYAHYGLIASSIANIARTTTEDTGPLLPWAGDAVYSDTERGVQFRSRIASVTVEAGDEYSYTVELGISNLSEHVAHAPSVERLVQQLSGGDVTAGDIGGGRPDDYWPDVTDETAPPEGFDAPYSAAGQIAATGSIINADVPGVVAPWTPFNALAQTNGGSAVDYLYLLYDAAGNIVVTSQTQQTLDAAADAYVRGGAFAGNNYGNQADILVAEGGAEPDATYIGLIRFSVAALAATVDQATLRFYVEDGVGANVIDVYAIAEADDDWVEGEVTYTTRPTDLTLLGNISVDDVGEFTLSNAALAAFVNADTDGFVSFALVGQGANLIKFGSRSAAVSGNQPKLIAVTQASNVAPAELIEDDGSLKSWRATFDAPGNAVWIRGRFRSAKTGGGYHWYPSETENLMVTRIQSSDSTVQWGFYSVHGGS